MPFPRPVAREILPDALWSLVEPLIPVDPPRPRGGRPRVAARDALRGILFVLRTGIQWRELPLEMGCGSGVTCWRRLRDWQAAGVWDRLFAVVLAELHARGRVDWHRAVLDSSQVQAKRGVKRRARTRRTEGDPAPSTTSWSTRGASRSARPR